jgi:hypothetical protein
VLIDDFDVPLLDNFHEIGDNIQETLKILNLDEGDEDGENEIELTNNKEKDSEIRRNLSPLLKTKLI